MALKRMQWACLRRCPPSVFYLIVGYFLGCLTTAIYHSLNGQRVTTKQIFIGGDNATDAYEAVISRVRLLCLVFTTKRLHKERAMRVRDTWGQHCGKLIFASDAVDPELKEAVNLNSTSSYEKLWSKVAAGFEWIHDKYVDDYDWFLKADDDTFVIVENLKLFLSRFSPNRPFYTGRRFINPNFVGQRATAIGDDSKWYAAGGAGYAVSRQGLKGLVVELRRRREVSYKGGMCPTESGGFEDANMGRCMSAAGLKFIDSHDEISRQRFNFLLPVEAFDPPKNHRNFMESYDTFRLVTGRQCCSDWAVSFHFAYGSQMNSLYYLLYNLRRFSPFTISDDEETKETPANIMDRLHQNGYVS